MTTTKHVVGLQPTTRKERRAADQAAGIVTRTESAPTVALPGPTVPAKGVARPNNLRSTLLLKTPTHRATSRVLESTYPWLVASGEKMRGAYVGEDELSRSEFCYDEWHAYDDKIIRSHSSAIIGVKGSGKSFGAKGRAFGLIRFGRKIAVPHDPNGEWSRIADAVGGKVVTTAGARINLLDAGVRDRDMSDDEWRQDVLRFRRGALRTVIHHLGDGSRLNGAQHTVIDLVLEELAHHDQVILPMVFDRFRTVNEWSDEPDIRAAARTLEHAIRRAITGDLAGMFDGPSTVQFDPTAPMMVVDTRSVAHAAPEAQGLVRMATSNWITRSTTGSHREPRVIVHEEAAIELLNDVTAGGAGLADKVADEKVARHKNTAHWYLLHRIADLQALGDEGSATYRQALGLLADCDTRVSYAQHEGELDTSAAFLGWNDTLRNMVRTLDIGTALWQIGEHRIAKVKNVITPGMKALFQTDHAGVRK